MRYVVPAVASNGTVIATAKSPPASALTCRSGLPSSQLIVMSAVDHLCPVTVIGFPGSAVPPMSDGPLGVGDGVAVGLGVGGTGVGVGSGGDVRGGGGGKGRTVRKGVGLGGRARSLGEAG